MKHVSYPVNLCSRGRGGVCEGEIKKKGEKTKREGGKGEKEEGREVEEEAERVREKKIE